MVTILFCSLLMASTWQEIYSSSETPTGLKVNAGSIERSVIELNIDCFHLRPVQTPAGEMYLAQLSDGASILEDGAPDIHKFARSIVIPEDKQMAINVLSSEYIDYENILIASSKGNLSRLIDPADVEYEFGPVYQQDEFSLAT